MEVRSLFIVIFGDVRFIVKLEKEIRDELYERFDSG